ncbi:MAG: hypothetical protein ABI561_23085, partial [Bradyrhizobium sp.]
MTLLVACLAADFAHAQVTNLEAGKSPSQIFAGTCNACHKSPRGLLKTVPASSLPGFLRQHYTTSSDMASVLASFLVSNGAADTRYQAKDAPKQDPSKKPDAKQEAKQDAKPEGKPDAKPEQLDRFGRKLHPAGAAQEASKPDADGIAPQNEGGRPGRDAKRMARPGQPVDGAKPADGQTPVQAATDSKSGGKQKLGKRGRPAVEEPKTDEAAKGDAAKDESGKTETSKTESGKTESGKTESGKTETAKSDAGKSDNKPDAAWDAKPAGEAKPAG